MSIQGESNDTGFPTSFVRLAGCPLRCSWCDTKYAFNNGTKVSIDEIIKKLDDFTISRVCLTGGEPLSQKNTPNLIKAILDKNYKLSIETSGAIDISNIDKRATIVMDVKTPSSSHCENNITKNIKFLKDNDQLKFVIYDKKDYDWALKYLNKYANNNKITILFSPVFGVLSPNTLAQWMIRDKVNVKLQLQLHKILKLK
jgi:7-carboxy-7-deazaguanine synthase